MTTRATSVQHAPTTLRRSEWTAAAEEHRRRAEALTAGRRERAARGETHPVEDFLFTYYSYKPAVLRVWHPGEHVTLRDATERSSWRWYRADGADVSVDGAAFRDARGGLLANIGAILRASARRTARFHCFGLHEWAMVYRQREHRHPLPLRLGQKGTDAVVDAHDLACSHYDAYRFFTPDAAPRNPVVLTRQTQAQWEQPGCLHAGMDLYKWAIKLGPLVPGELLLDTFEHAAATRRLDMRASPYDLSDWGYDAVPIESAEGKAQYVREQRALADTAATLRARLLQILDTDAADIPQADAPHADVI